jgi:DNA-binding SARP family transcriptional activator
MASATLRIRLLGELDLRQGEAPVAPLGSARAESLLAYLLLHRDAPQPRQRLAFLLWPDSSEPRPAPTCATCSTTCAGPCPTPSGTSR